MLLEYIALGILIFVVLVIFYAIIAIHDIPYEIAKKRNHPHLDVLRLAGWVSLFTLHAIWPLLYAWSAAYRETAAAKIAPRFAEINEDTAINDKAEYTGPKLAQLEEDITDSVTLLGHRYEVLDDRIERIEKAIMAATEAA